ILVLGEALKSSKKRSTSLILLKAMSNSGMKALPKEWANVVYDAVRSKDDEVVREAIVLIRKVPMSKEQFEGILLIVSFELGHDFIKNPNGTLKFKKLLALEAAAPPSFINFDKSRCETQMGHMRSLDSEERSLAIEASVRGAWAPDALEDLAKFLNNLSPLDLPKILPVFAKSTNEKVGLAFVAALTDPKVLPSVRSEVVKPILDKYPPAVRAEAEKLYARLAETRKGETAKLERLVKELPAGDIRRGQAVFNGAK